MNIKDLMTEQRNPNTMHIDAMSTIDIVRVINQEDHKVAYAVEKQISQIAKAIDLASKKYQLGGRLIYMGAGTSGRLGVLDAAELVPTYGISPDRAIGLIAGGKQAMFNAVEGAEDSINLGEKDLKKVVLDAKDVVIGIAASGRTPYVIGGLQYANKIGAATISVSCVPNSLIGKESRVAIEAIVGPEAITGSTRMKAGTAQKMILNMISTAVMIKNGKVYQNIMIDVQPTNSKLIDRSIRIIQDCTGVNKETAKNVLKASNKNVPIAIVMAKTGFSREEAEKKLNENGNSVEKVLNS